MSKILLTGAAGFIGSWLSERLLAQGHEVVGVDNFDEFYARPIKIRNLEKSRAFDGFRFVEMDLSDASALSLLPSCEAVIHLAAKAGIQPSVKDPAAYIRHNIQATQHLLAWMQVHHIKKMVFASSSSIYGNNPQIPFRESDNVDFPISPYAFTKKAGELMTHTYHYLYGMDVLNLRFFTVYGPRQRPDLAIHKFVRLITQGEALTMYGDGSTARDYTYVEDTVQGILQALAYVQNHEQVYEIINLGNHTPVALSVLIDLLYELMGKKPNIHTQPVPPGDVDITYADIEKARQLLGYQPQTDFKTGLQKFIDWYAKPY
ncbi:MAG: GDP-mannose 4,6-dehydratase [Microscillaceae bacterium]